MFHGGGDEGGQGAEGCRGRGGGDPMNLHTSGLQSGGVPPQATTTATWGVIPPRALGNALPVFGTGASSKNPGACF